MFGGACMSEKLDFYEVNVDYVKYLKQFDSRILVLCQDFGQLKYKNFQFLV